MSTRPKRPPRGKTRACGRSTTPRTALRVLEWVPRRDAPRSSTDPRRARGQQHHRAHGADVLRLEETRHGLVLLELNSLHTQRPDHVLPQYRAEHHGEDDRVLPAPREARAHVPHHGARHGAVYARRARLCLGREAPSTSHAESRLQYSSSNTSGMHAVTHSKSRGVTRSYASCAHAGTSGASKSSSSGSCNVAVRSNMSGMPTDPTENTVAVPRACMGLASVHPDALVAIALSCYTNTTA